MSKWDDYSAPAQLADAEDRAYFRALKRAEEDLYGDPPDNDEDCNDLSYGAAK